MTAPHRIVSLVVLLAIACAASAGIGPERPFPLTTTGTSVSDATYDGAQYLVVYNDAGQLRGRRIDNRGALAGQPFTISSTPANSVHTATNEEGLSLAAFSVADRPGHTSLRLAWIPRSSDASPPFAVIDLAPWDWSFSVADVGGHFVIAWSDSSGVYTARFEPLATQASAVRKVAATGFVDEIASDGTGLLLRYTTTPPVFACNISPCIPPQQYHLQLLTSDGAAASDDLGWPPSAEAAIPDAEIGVFVLRSGDVIARSGALLDRWSIRRSQSVVRAGRSLYAIRSQPLYNISSRELYFGPVAADGTLSSSYRLIGSKDIYGTRLIAGADTVLAIYSLYSPDAVMMAYRVIDLVSPFPALPPPPASVFGAVAQSGGIPDMAKARFFWTAVDGAAYYVVEAEPLSDPSAWYYPAFISPETTDANLDPITSDVLYAFRVYAANESGLSAPAQFTARTPASRTARPPSESSYAIHDGMLIFRWRDASSNETAFRIRVCDSQHLCRSMELPASSTTATIPLFPGFNSYQVLTVYGNGSESAAWESAFYLSGPTRVRPARR